MVKSLQLIWEISNALFPMTITVINSGFLRRRVVVILFKTMYNKTIIRFGGCGMLNNQGLGKCYQPRPSARLGRP